MKFSLQSSALNSGGPGLLTVPTSSPQVRETSRLCLGSPCLHHSLEFFLMQLLRLTLLISPFLGFTLLWRLMSNVWKPLFYIFHLEVFVCMCGGGWGRFKWEGISSSHYSMLARSGSPKCIFVYVITKIKIFQRVKLLYGWIVDPLVSPQDTEQRGIS